MKATRHDTRGFFVACDSSAIIELGNSDVQKCVSSVELGKTSLNCKNCFKELSTCIIDKCSGPCFKENADHNQCEKCAKDVKCSLDECNSPNYFLHKRKVPGMPVRIFS